MLFAAVNESYNIVCAEIVVWYEIGWIWCQILGTATDLEISWSS